jgi:hypothetical protein
MPAAVAIFVERKCVITCATSEVWMSDIECGYYLLDAGHLAL